MKKLLCLFLVFVLTGCSFDFDDLSYKKGDYEYKETIESIYIDWAEGTVEINQADQQTVTIAEEADRDLTRNEKVRSKIENGVLIIKYCKSTTTIDDVTKALVITVPSGMTLKTVEYVGKNAQVLIWETNVEDKITFTSPTGTLETDLLTPVKEIAISGDGVSANLNVADVEKITAATVTGNIAVYPSGEIESMELSTESGAVILFMPTPNFSVKTVNPVNDLKTGLDYHEKDDLLIFGEGGTAYTVTLGETASLSAMCYADEAIE